MPSAYSSSLRLVLPVTGELSGTWGDTVNAGLTNLVDSAVAGYSSVAMTDADYTLTSANGAADQARSMIINMTGTLTATRNVICPTLSKVYAFKNATTGGFAITLKTTAGTGISVANGETKWLYCDGTNVVGFSYTYAPTSGSSILKGNGSGGISNAASGTDYAPATSGSVILKGNGAGGFSAAASGTDYAPATSGSAVLKGNGAGGFSTATAGTDYVAPGTATTFTALQTFNGTSALMSSKFVNSLEAITVSATAATGTVAYDVTTQSVVYYTTNASSNWTVNFRASSGTTLNTVMATGEAVTVAFMVTQGGTAYYNVSVQVDGTTTGVTMKWQDGAPTAGDASAINVYAYTIVKTGSATFTVFASKAKFN